jgi:4Fe-4S binding domain
MSGVSPRSAVGSDERMSPPQPAGGLRLPMAEARGPRSSPGVDLNANPVTRFLLTNSRVQPTLQIVVIVVFAWAVWQAFAGPQNTETNFGAIAFFGLWWTPIMLLSLMLFGRVWCYVCPIGAITQFLQRFSLDRRFPTFRKPKWRVFGLSLSVLSIAALSFTLARLPLYKFGVAYTPWKMGVYFLIFLGVAVTLSLIFRQRVFCRYVCPATGVMSVTTRFSPFELTQDRDAKVPDCMTAEFRSNYLSTERRCVACMHCTVDQPDVPVRLRARWPGAAAVRQRLLIPDEALIALIIWAVFPIDHVLGGQLIDPLPMVQALPPLLAGAAPYYTSILAAILSFAAINWLAARWSGIDARTAFTRFAFAYAPLGLLFQVGVHLVPGLMEDGGGLLNGFAAGLGIPLHLPVAWASAETLAAWQRSGGDAFLWLSVVWGGLLAWLIARGMTETRARAAKALIPHLALMALSTYVVTMLLV